MKERQLRPNHILVLETLIKLWSAKSDPVTQADIRRIIPISDANISRLTEYLAKRGFIEKIVYNSRDQELKPLKFPDGSDFLAQWQPQKISEKIISLKVSVPQIAFTPDLASYYLAKGRRIIHPGDQLRASMKECA